MKTIPGGITKAKGFLSNGVACGIKQSGRLDLGLISSQSPAVTAGVFTANSVIAAPLVVSKKHLKNNKAQAIVINSGNANCFTGDFGLLYAKQTAEVVGEKLGISPADVVVASTGIIGKPLPFKKIKKAVPSLVKGLDKDRAHKTALSILTTDKKTKEYAVQIKIDGKTVTIGGCAKGSGMTAPNMATMLAFLTTDAKINASCLKKALKIAVDKSFNSITVDGCMSTNDMVVVMANGAAENKTIKLGDANFRLFCDALTEVCRDLAKKIILDAEGATKFISIEVTGAETFKQAKAVGLAVANSALVKTAAFGSNPNWGRVAQAVGALGIKKINETNLKIDFSSFKKKAITIFVGLNLGKENATIYTSDLSYEYVRINVEYN